jgi:choline dehydrogenase-like flavoprotein
MIDAANLTYGKLDASNPHLHRPETPEDFDAHYQCQVNGVSHEPADGSAENSAPANAGVTAHPLGGAVMGRACDFFGRVQGYRGLYVVDGAFIPGSTAATNPAFTIAAFAERSMADILARDFVEEGAAARAAVSAHAG